jgi:hypothetical protein
MHLKHEQYIFQNNNGDFLENQYDVQSFSINGYILETTSPIFAPTFCQKIIRLAPGHCHHWKKDVAPIIEILGATLEEACLKKG